MAKSRRTKTDRPIADSAVASPPALRPAPARWQKVFLAIAVALLIGWLAVLVLMAIRHP
jgi:hypothetical protein